ncbi:MAG: ABC transporter substrate-binding protein [Clostridiaceae bacterium]
MKKYIALIICIFVLISGCVERKKDIHHLDNKDSIVYGVETFPKDLILLDDIKGEYNYLLVNLFEGLVKKDDEGNIVPGLAYKWDIEENGTKYTFKIRNDAKWNNGESITARDFVYFFSEVLNLGINNVFDYHLFYIKGLEEYRKGEINFSDTGVKEVDKNTLEIKLKYPCSYFLDILSNPKYSLRKINYTLKSWEKDYNYIAYSGPYIIKNANKDTLELEDNTQYWDSENVENKKMTIQNEGSEEGVLAAFATSKVDFLKVYNLWNDENIKDGSYIIENDSYIGKALAFNFKRDKVKDNKLRKDIYDSIDRNYIAKNIFKDTASPWKYSKDRVGSSDKYEDLSLELVYIKNKYNDELVKEIKKQLKNKLNINILLKGYNELEIKDVLDKNSYDIVLLDIIKEYKNPISFYEKICSNNRFNFYNYKNETYDNIIFNAKKEGNTVEQDKLLNEGEKILIEEVPVVPILLVKNFIYTNNSIYNILLNYNGDILFNNISFNDI